MIVGDGTEYSKIEQAFQSKDINNVKLMKRVPKDDYDRMIAACDVGLIFLDYRFTIPNYPSRLLSYMQANLPVLACTDINTDIGQTIDEGDFGWWCPSNDIEVFKKTINELQISDKKGKGIRAKEYLLKHFSSKTVYSRMSMD